jgi:hypothetical protein
MAQKQKKRTLKFQIEIDVNTDFKETFVVGCVMDAMGALSDFEKIKVSPRIKVEGHLADDTPKRIRARYEAGLVDPL